MSPRLSSRAITGTNSAVMLSPPWFGCDAGNAFVLDECEPWSQIGFDRQVSHLSVGTRETGVDLVAEKFLLVEVDHLDVPAAIVFTPERPATNLGDEHPDTLPGVLVGHQKGGLEVGVALGQVGHCSLPLVSAVMPGKPAAPCRAADQPWSQSLTVDANVENADDLAAFPRVDLTRFDPYGTVELLVTVTETLCSHGASFGALDTIILDGADVFPHEDSYQPMYLASTFSQFRHVRYLCLGSQ